MNDTYVLCDCNLGMLSKRGMNQAEDPFTRSMCFDRDLITLGDNALLYMA